ncbi:MAG: flagellar basal body-associated FliL family protein [Enterobacteriaceae bacterium]
MSAKNIFFGLVALLVTASLTAVLVIWGYSTFVKQELDPGVRAEQSADIEREPLFSRKKTDRQAKEVKFVEVGNIIVTLKGDGRRERYMQLELALAAYDEEEVKKCESIIPALRGATLLVLSNRDYSEVREMPIKELREALLKAFEETLGKFGSKVYFHDLVISKLVFQ